MSVQSEIDRIKGNVAGAYSAVAEKGGAVPRRQNSDSLPDAIRSIPGGLTQEQADKRYLKLAGGTLTGALSVQAPAADSDAATKKYVDDAVTGAGANLLMVQFNITSSDTGEITTSCDKTFDEIAAAIRSGMPVMAKAFVDNYFQYLTSFVSASGDYVPEYINFMFHTSSTSLIPEFAFVCFYFDGIIEQTLMVGAGQD